MFYKASAQSAGFINEVVSEILPGSLCIYWKTNFPSFMHAISLPKVMSERLIFDPKFWPFIVAAYWSGSAGHKGSYQKPYLHLHRNVCAGS